MIDRGSGTGGDRPFSFFDHTGDIGVRLEGRTPADVFRAAALAFGESTTEVGRVEPRQTRRVALEADALDLLLVDFLNEILYLFDVHRFLVADASAAVERAHGPASAGSAWRLQATLSGEPFDPSRHRITLLVKAITYHALEVAEDADGWHATVVFDI